MKKILLVILLFSSAAYSQNEVGLKMIDIESRFKEPKYDLKQVLEEDGTTTLSVKLENANATYYFDNDSFKLSNTLVITPDSQKSLEKYIKLYDSKYKRANSTKVKWKVKTIISNDISIIETINLSKMTIEGDEFYVLIWSFENEN
jgi:hypothetical protein